MRKTTTRGEQRSHIHDQVTSAIRKSNELHTRHQKVDPPRTTMWKRRSPRRIKHSKGHATEGSSQFIHGGWRTRCSPTAGIGPMREHRSDVHTRRERERYDNQLVFARSSAVAYFTATESRDDCDQMRTEFSKIKEADQAGE